MHMDMQYSSGPKPKYSGIVFIYDGTERDRYAMESIIKHMQRRTRHPITIYSARSEEGRELVRRYQLHGTHFVLVIRTNGDLHHMWNDEDRLDSPHIASLANQMH